MSRRVPLKVDDIPLDLEVVVTRGATATGRLEWAGDGLAPWRQRPVSTWGRLRALPADRGSYCPGAETEVRADGTFALKDLYGPRRIWLVPRRQDWAVVGG